MPLDNSGTQSFRTHRLRCKAIAGGRVQNAAMRLSKEQTVPESTFVDFKLGRMPYLVQPNGGPATVDAGCCGSAAAACPGEYCSYIIGASSISEADYIDGQLTIPQLPGVPDGYTNTVMVIGIYGCNQTYNITGVSYSGGHIEYGSGDIYIVQGIIPPEGPPIDFIVIFPTTIVPEEELLTVTGTIEPCGLSLIPEPFLGRNMKSKLLQLFNRTA